MVLGMFLVLKIVLQGLQETQFSHLTINGVLKMLNGKMFSEYVQALRMLVVEFLRPFVGDISWNWWSPFNMYWMMKPFKAEKQSSGVFLIGQVPTIMKYIGALREADWLLHLVAVKDMRPLFCFQPFQLSLSIELARKSPIAFHEESTHNLVRYENRNILYESQA